MIYLIAGLILTGAILKFMNYMTANPSEYEDTNQDIEKAAHLMSTMLEIHGRKTFVVLIIIAPVVVVKIIIGMIIERRA
jgi:hypothetical protein